MDTKSIWKKTLAQIEIKISDTDSFNRFFRFSQINVISSDSAEVAFAGQFITNIVKNKYKELITETLQLNVGKKVKVSFVSDNTLAQSLQKYNSQDIIEDPDDIPLFQLNDGLANSESLKLEKCQINSKYTFANFIVGNSNRLAHAAALAIANTQGRKINPLFIYGKPGLGKTHLAQAVGRQLIERDFATKVLYVASETFLNDLVNSIKTNKTNDFKKKYRELDCLIIDDIQMISKWVETQTEFFNTFNALSLSDKQIILISDRPPEEIEKLEERIRSRFSGGLVVNIMEPELETRVAILIQKQKELETNLPHQTLNDIARIVMGSIRELEGALAKINVFQSIRKGELLSSAEIESILGKTVTERKMRMKPQEVIKFVCERYGFEPKEVKSTTRVANVALVRQICIYVLYKEFKLTLEDIAKIFGKKDHSTIIHSRNKIEKKLKAETDFRNQMNKLIDEIYNAK